MSKSAESVETPKVTKIEEAQTSYKPSHRSEGQDTINIEGIQYILMPIAIVFSTFIFSVFMYLSAGRLADSGSFGKDNYNAPPTQQVQQPTAAAITPQPQQPPAEPTIATVSLDDDAVRGNKNTATIAIVEFSDYECPFCGKFYKETLSQIEKEYIDTGKAIIVYRDLPLSFHPFAQKQAEAAECAGEEGDENYYKMHDKIFEGGGQYDVEGLKGLASEIGLDVSKFSDCLDSGRMASEITKDSNDASIIGINGTPGFVIGKINPDGTVQGDIVSGAQPFSVFKSKIESNLE